MEFFPEEIAEEVNPTHELVFPSQDLAPERHNENLTNFWQSRSAEISGLNDLGACFRIIKVFADGDKVTESKSATFTRSQTAKSFKKFYDRISKTKQLSKD